MMANTIRVIEVKKSLYSRAVRRFGEITPCYGRTFNECFTKNEGNLAFWFNDRTGNTHLVTNNPPGRG